MINYQTQKSRHDLVVDVVVVVVVVVRYPAVRYPLPRHLEGKIE